jgi:hypothetical protein
MDGPIKCSSLTLVCEHLMTSGNLLFRPVFIFRCDGGVTWWLHMRYTPSPSYVFTNHWTQITYPDDTVPSCHWLIRSCIGIIMGISCLQRLFKHCTTMSMSQGSSVSISDWLRTGRPGFDPRQEQRIFLLDSVSKPALGPTQPPVQWVPGVLSPGVKRGRVVMLTTHHLVSRLSMSRSYTSSLCASMACSGTALLTFLLLCRCCDAVWTHRRHNTEQHRHWAVTQFIRTARLTLKYFHLWSMYQSKPSIIVPKMQLSLKESDLCWNVLHVSA